MAGSEKTLKVRGQSIQLYEGGGGPPLLEDALGWVVCARRTEHDAGDHTLFVGEATSVDQGPGGSALVHVGQAYTAL